MGNFLPAPITEKHTQRGEGNDVTFALSSMQGWRMTMEDSHVTALAPTGLPPGVSVFAVFDGHGGQLTAQLAAEELTSHFAKTMKASAVFNGKDGEADPAKIGDAMNDAYMALDEYIKDVHTREYGDDQSGCTAISALLTSTHIIVANSGDSRSVLATNRSTTIEMSYDHKPVNPGERARIERAGGVVRSNRVNGDLAVSRALGDFSYKDRPDMKAEEQKVSAKPDIKVHKLDGTEEFLVLACDGIWDVMTNEELCAYVRKLMRDGETDLGLVAEEVIDYCLRAGSRDNMSIIVVKFPNAEVGEGGGVKAIRAERERLDAEAKAAGEGEVDDDLAQAGLTFTPAKSS